MNLPERMTFGIFLGPFLRDEIFNKKTNEKF